jgi:hypothetical protein
LSPQTIFNELALPDYRQRSALVRASCGYPSRRTLRDFADAARLEIGFLQRGYLEHSRGRSARLFRKAKSIGLAVVAAPLLEIVCQRMMALRKAC